METKSQHSENNEKIAKSKLVSKSNIVGSEGKEKKQQEFATIDNNNNIKISAQHESGKENHSMSTNQQQQQQQQEKFCSECKRSLVKSSHLICIVGQTNKAWHPECFKCNICNNQLDREVSCHVYKEKIICKQDYLKLQRDNKSIKCSRCKWSISSLDWVRKAGDYVYHLACFSCDICMRQLSTGEQFTLNVVRDEKRTVRLLCRLHFAIENSPEIGTQSANNIIKPSSLQLTNHNQHRQATSSAIDSNEQRLSPIAAQVSSSSSIFDINQTYPSEHQQTQLSYNNKHSFATFNHGHYLDLLQTTTNKQAQFNLNNRQFLMIDRANSANHSNKNQKNHHIDHYDRHEEQHHNNSQLSIVDEIRQHLNEGSGGGPASDASTSSSTNGSTSGHLIGGSQSKSKRVRTTFTEDQLSILQTHFQIDSNPDGQDLERIATITGLSKRVTQVWFQNSRARQKKYMIKRKPSNNSSSSPTIVCASNQTNIKDNINSQSSARNTNSSVHLVTTTSADNENQHRTIKSMDYQDNSQSDGQQLQNRHSWSKEPTINKDLSFGSIDPNNNCLKDIDHSSSDSSSNLVDDEEDQLILSDDY